MSPYAQLNGGIATSEDWACLCKGTPAELYAMTWAASNVYGVVVGSLRSFRAKVCPLLSLNDARLEKLIEALVSAGHFVAFEAEGKEWFWMPSWNRQNEVRWETVGPPNLPLPPGWVMPEKLREALESPKTTDKLKRLRRFFSRPPYREMWDCSEPERDRNGDGTVPVPYQFSTGSEPVQLSRAGVCARLRARGAGAGDGDVSDSEGEGAGEGYPDPHPSYRSPDDHLHGPESAEWQLFIAEVSPAIPPTGNGYCNRREWGLELAKKDADAAYPLHGDDLRQALRESPPSSATRPREFLANLEKIVKARRSAESRHTEAAQERLTPEQRRQAEIDRQREEAERDFLELEAM